MNLRTALRLGTALLPALALAVSVPGTAHAAGTYGHHDGTRETEIRINSADGHDNAYGFIPVPARHVNGAHTATLSVYAKAEGCGAAGAGHRIRINLTEIATFDPCAVWSQTAYGWHDFPVPLTALDADGTNFVDLYDIDPVPPTSPLGGAPARDAAYGVDSSSGARDSLIQEDAGDGHYVTGALMWHLTLTGSAPAIGFAPDGVAFGTYAIGTTSAARTVTVQSTGVADLTVSSLTVAGAAAADFAVGSDTCTGVTLPPGSSCTFAVTFTPSAGGSRYATVDVAAPGAVTRSVALHGESPTAPPVSAFTTQDGAVLLQGDHVTGVVSTASTLRGEWVTFVPVVPFLATVTQRASVTCAASCTWSADQLLAPGRYTAIAHGEDVQGNVETPGPSITVVVV